MATLTGLGSRVGNERRELRRFREHHDVRRGYRYGRGIDPFRHGCFELRRNRPIVTSNHVKGGLGLPRRCGNLTLHRRDICRPLRRCEYLNLGCGEPLGEVLRNPLRRQLQKAHAIWAQLGANRGRDARDQPETKAPIFERRTLERYRPVERVETAAEALAVSLNERGEIHWPRMEQLTSRTAEQLRRELGSLVFRNPEGGWETADRYLSGNVRAKLATTTSAAEIDSSYRRNIEALKAVQPPDLGPGDIEARLGWSWIPATDIRDFVAQLLDIPVSDVHVAHAGAIAAWTVQLEPGARWHVSNTTAWGTSRFRASELIDQAPNGRTPTAYDEHEDGSRTINQQETIAAREKQQQLKDRFREWIWQDGERASRLARDYNERFNNLRLCNFDGSHLTLPGMVRENLRDRDLARHQSANERFPAPA